MGNDKHVDQSENGRYNIYTNGLGTNKSGDGYAHDDIWANVNKNGDVTHSGMADRSEQRDKVIRGLGGAALR